MPLYDFQRDSEGNVNRAISGFGTLEQQRLQREALERQEANLNRELPSQVQQAYNFVLSEVQNGRMTGDEGAAIVKQARASENAPQVIASQSPEEWQPNWNQPSQPGQMPGANGLPVPYDPALMPIPTGRTVEVPQPQMSMSERASPLGMYGQSRPVQPPPQPLRMRDLPAMEAINPLLINRMNLQARPQRNYLQELLLKTEADLMKERLRGGTQEKVTEMKTGSAEKIAEGGNESREKVAKGRDATAIEVAKIRAAAQEISARIRAARSGGSGGSDVKELTRQYTALVSSLARMTSGMRPAETSPEGMAEIAAARVELARVKAQLEVAQAEERTQSSRSSASEEVSVTRKGPAPSDVLKALQAK